MSDDEPRAACHRDGSYAVVRNRAAFWSYNLCGDCFDGPESIEDIPTDWSLVRTVSDQHGTIHRDAADVDGVLVADRTDPDRDDSYYATISEMDPQEFERRVLGGDA